MQKQPQILTPEGNPMLTARRAAKRLNCAPDYVGRLCREGKLQGMRVKNAWFVDEVSIVEFEKSRSLAKVERREELSQQRREENEAYRKVNNLPIAKKVSPVHAPVQTASPRKSFFKQSLALALGAVLLVSTVAIASAINSNTLANTGLTRSLSASLGRLDSPFFGTHPVSVSVEDINPQNFAFNLVSKFLALFMPKTKIASSPAPGPAYATTTIVQNTYPVIERTTERVIVDGNGISRGEFEDRIVSLQQFVVSMTGIRPIFLGGGASGGGSSISDTGATLTNTTFLGSFTNSSNATSTFANGIDIAAGCFAINGTCVTGSGSAAGSTGSIQFNNAGSFAASTTALYWDDTNGRLGIGTSSPLSMLHLNNGGVIRINANDGSSSGCFRQGAAGLEYSNDCSSFQSFTSASAGGWTDDGAVVRLTTNTDNAGIGTTTPYAKLTTWGSGILFEAVTSASTTVFTIGQSGATTTSLFATTASSTNLFASIAQLGSLTLNAFNGPLHANNGIVSATSSVGVLYGGTGLTLAPSYGQVLLGNAAGGYTLSATSSLGLLGSTSISAVTPLFFNSSTGVFTITQSNSSTNGYLASTDWNVFNNKVSSSSLSGQSVISYNSSTGVITTVGGTFGTGDYIFPNKVTTPYASTTAITATTASTTNLVVSNLGASAGQCLTTDSSGTVTSTTCGSGAFSFTPTTNFGALANSTSTPIWFTQGLQAASTSYFTDVSFVNATTSSLYSSGRSVFAATGGNVGIGTTTPNSASILHIDGGNALTRIIFDADAGNPRIFSFRTDNKPRWAFRVDGTESGGNTGSDFAIRNYDDAGTLIDTPLFITRSTSNVGIGTTSPYAKLSVVGQAVAAYFTATTTATSTFPTLLSTNSTSTNFYSSVLTAGNATTTNLAVTNLLSALLTTNSLGSVVASSTLSIQYGGTGISTAPNYGNILIGNSSNGYTLTATSSLGLLGSTSISASAPLSWNSQTGALTISQSGSGTDGYVSSTDWNLFNNKISSTSLSAVYPLAYNSATGVFTTAFSTTTQNNFNAHNTFSSLFATSASTTNATTTNLHITGIISSLLKTDANGRVTAAVAGTDYANFAFPWTPTTSFGTNANSTSTLLLLTNGLSASSTVRFGNANGSILSFDSATGRLGLGTSTPFAQFTIFASTTNGVALPTTLFAIASSSAGVGTTTLFSISNTGLTTVLNLSATGATTSALAVTASSTIGGVLN
ncbi:MAG: helix-turn-helix domain-containing protein, partial [Patescibacteria group bacterium]